MSEPNGGPAYPCVMPGPARGKAGPSRIYYSGISVRDYFAAAALTGMLCSMASHDCRHAARKKADEAGCLLHEGLAISAYAYADAMLRERDQ